MAKTSVLTLEQAATLVGYRSPSALRHAIRRGTLSANYEVVNGRARHVVSRAELERWLADRRTHNADGRTLQATEAARQRSPVG